MIVLEDVHKSFWVRREQRLALRGVTITFPPKRNVAVLGAPGSGKSTLMRLLAGVDSPTRGKIRRERRVSWLIGQGTGLQGDLTGRQNARFVCRVQGTDEADLDERIRFVHDFSELGEDFDRPVSGYSATMRRQLSFSLATAFEFDVYLFEGQVGGVGRDLFRQKSKDEMKLIAGRADIIVVAKSERVARSFCDAAVLLHEGRAHWFDSVREGWKAYKKGLAA